MHLGLTRCKRLGRRCTRHRGIVDRGCPWNISRVRSGTGSRLFTVTQRLLQRLQVRTFALCDANPGRKLHILRRLQPHFRTDGRDIVPVLGLQHLILLFTSFTSERGARLSRLRPHVSTSARPGPPKKRLSSRSGKSFSPCTTSFLKSPPYPPWAGIDPDEMYLFAKPGQKENPTRRKTLPLLERSGAWPGARATLSCVHSGSSGPVFLRP